MLENDREDEGGEFSPRPGDEGWEPCDADIEFALKGIESISRVLRRLQLLVCATPNDIQPTSEELLQEGVTLGRIIAIAQSASQGYTSRAFEVFWPREALEEAVFSGIFNVEGRTYREFLEHVVQCFSLLLEAHLGLYRRLVRDSDFWPLEPEVIELPPLTPEELKVSDEALARLLS